MKSDIRMAFIITSQDALWKNSQEKMAILIYCLCAVTLTTSRLNETKEYCIESKRWRQEAQSVITGLWGIKRRIRANNPKEIMSSSRRNAQA